MVKKCYTCKKLSKMKIISHDKDSVKYFCSEKCFKKFEEKGW